jgi:hypothetical protein
LRRGGGGRILVAERELRGAADVVALGIVDAELAQQDQALFVFHALGHRLQIEAAGQVDDRLHHLATGPALAQVTDELDVDLQVIDRELLEVGEPAVARAEVVESDLAAELVQRGDEPAADRLVAD